MIGHTMLGRRDPRQRLAELAGKRLNFQTLDVSERWHRDDYRQQLPAEPPGPPLADGSWEAARRLVREYAFADPDIVRAYYDHGGSLEERNVLLELRFAGLSFFVGARVCRVYDETREEGGTVARVWGWDYATLEGHVEKGRRNFEVWKWRDTGAVEFRTFSTSAPAGGPLIRLGYRIVGRHRQAEFGRRACERMARLTAAAVAATDDRPRPEAAGDDDGRRRLMAIYLDDHVALLTAGAELAKRIVGTTTDDEIRSFMEALRSELGDDRRSAMRLLGSLGRRPSSTKQALAWTAEKAARSKLNGRITRRSPLTPLVELDAVRLVLEANRARWRSIERAGLAAASTDAGRRGARAERRLLEVEDLRLRAAERAIGTNHATA